MLLFLFYFISAKRKKKKKENINSSVVQFDFFVPSVYFTPGIS